MEQLKYLNKVQMHLHLAVYLEMEHHLGYLHPPECRETVLQRNLVYHTDQGHWKYFRERLNAVEATVLLAQEADLPLIQQKMWFHLHLLFILHR